MQEMSQAASILRHMKRHGSIDPLSALRKYGTMRLAARILELRQQGYPIRSEMVVTFGGTRVAQYRLEG
jgi:hypothetical protein